MHALVLVYAAGAVVALWRTDGPWLTRLLLALVWPVGVAAFGITTALLLAAAAVLFPWFGVVLAAVLLGGLFLRP